MFDDSILFEQLAERDRDEIPEIEENSGDFSAADEQEESPETTDANGAPSLPPLSEDDYIFSEGALEFFDETRAMLLSVYSTGDIASVERYRYYKDFEEGKHKYIVRAAARIIQKWQVGANPEYILGAALISSSYFLWKRAEADRKEIKAQAEAEARERQAKQQQKQQGGSQQGGGPKVVKMQQQPPGGKAL